jgi:hypothetical protein
MQNVSPKALPHARWLAAIESARLVVNNKAPQAAVSTVRQARAATTAIMSARNTASIASRGVAAATAPLRALTGTRLLRAGGIAGGVLTLGYVAAQSNAGQKALQHVKGFFRTNESGRTSYVRPLLALLFAETLFHLGASVGNEGEPAAELSCRFSNNLMDRVDRIVREVGTAMIADPPVAGHP